MERIREFFTYEKPQGYISVSNTPPRLYRQERDWTCSIACIRTLLSGRVTEVASENEFIEKFELVPGPHYVDEMIEKQMLAPARVVKTNRNFAKEKIGLPLLARLLEEKYYVMAECMYNYAHWVVVLGYFAVRNAEDTEEHRILIYDPYYDQVRLVIADEFLTMWCDPAGHEKEFVAIR